MKVQRYNPVNMSLLEDSAEQLDFGTVYQGHLCEELQVIRPVKTTESEITDLQMFLNSKGAYTNSTFGFGVTGLPVSGLLPGSNFLTGVFTPGASGVGPGVSIQDEDFVYLNVLAGANEKGNYPGVNYSLVFDYV
jgi:hypothetical protein